MVRPVVAVVFALLTLLGAASCSDGSGQATTDSPPPPPPPPPPPAEPQASDIVVPKITISTVAADIAKGEEIFAAKGCIACHKMDGTKLVGPSLKGVTARRELEWIEKMILKPDIMLKSDEAARKMLAEHMTPMPNQNVDASTELPYILAFLKSHEN